MGKQNQVQNDSQTPTLDLDNIFHWKEEENCYKGMYSDIKRNGKNIPYRREKPIPRYAGKTL
jgi:hypothetical protein